VYELHVREFNCSTTQAACYPGNDAESSNVSSAAECCATCQKVAKAVGYTFNPVSTSHGKNCYCKAKMGKGSPSKNCISGGTTSPIVPSPAPGPKPPSPAPPPSGGSLLFNVMDDPGEVMSVNPLSL
jgi:hypothetical protein